MILSCKDVHKAYGIDVILDKITFHIEEHEKAAVVGVNGAGKSTLFKMIAGGVSLDDGEIFIPKDISLGYMEQNKQIEGNTTIYGEMLTVFEDILSMEKKLREMEGEMAQVPHGELEEFMENYGRLQHAFEEKNGYGYQSRIKGVLKGLGFSQEEYEKPLSTLSGGQKTRVYLGRLLLSQPDLLLLDEPTNHLDIDSIQWLEDFLRGYPGAVLIVSHDRYFLDRTVTKIIEIENKKSSVYEGNYTFYSQQKEINREILLKQYTQQQKEIKHQEDVIRTLKSFNREKSIKRAESREKALGKMERIDRPDSLPEKMRLTLKPKITSGNDVLFAEELSKSFDGRHLFSHVSFDIKREEKIAIIGPNGVGKSTLFKMLLGRVSSDSGKIKIGTNVHIGYYDQEQQGLDDNKTIFQEIADAYPTLTNGQIRNVLAAFVFTGDDINKPIAALSGGEKGRVSLAKIMLSEANLLMLDEPTNHLDMYSKEILENAINLYTGTVVYISHDRYFINKTAQKILELTPEGVYIYLGNYSYYLEKKAQREREEAERTSVETNASAFVSDSKNEWMRQKEEQANLRKKANRISKLETRIEETEQKIEALNTQLFQEEISTDAWKAQELYEQKAELEELLNELYEQWEEAQE